MNKKVINCVWHIFNFKASTERWHYRRTLNQHPLKLPTVPHSAAPWASTLTGCLLRITQQHCSLNFPKSKQILSVNIHTHQFSNKTYSQNRATPVISSFSLPNKVKIWNKNSQACVFFLIVVWGFFCFVFF